MPPCLRRGQGVSWQKSTIGALPARRANRAGANADMADY
jgi:hypothetical protein